jgi:hypothetical protein
VEPSDYFPDAFYRSPPDEPQREVVRDRRNPNTDQLQSAMIRHKGRAEHYHVQRAGRPESDQQAD